MVYTFIINPRAGSARLRRRQRRLLEAVSHSGLEHRFHFTERPKHATQLAREAAASSDVVVAVGGDGTAHEVADGLIASGCDAHLAVVPTGTGNDFAKMFHMFRNIDRIVDGLREGTPRPVDYGRVRWDGPGGGGAGIFINMAGTGFDAKVAAAAARFKYLTGMPRYLVAVLRTIRQWSAPHAVVDIRSGGRTVYTAASRVLTVMAANGKCAAGGFYLTPDAAIDDGRLDACVIESASVARILFLIPRVLRGGRHVGEPEVTVVKSEAVTVELADPQAVQADGEILTEAARCVSFDVVPGGLSVVMPVKS